MSRQGIAIFLIVLSASIAVIVVFVGSLIAFDETQYKDNANDSTRKEYQDYLVFLKEHSDEDWGTVWEQVWGLSEEISIPASIVKSYADRQIAADKVLEHIRAYVFWIIDSHATQYSFEASLSGGLVIRGLTYWGDAVGMRDAVDDKIIEALSHIRADKKRSTVEAIDAYLRYSVAYGDTELQSGQTIPSALVNGEAVCAGYASTFNVLALLSGLESRIVTGYLKSEAKGSVRHAWNSVAYGSSEVYTDSTANDTNRRVRLIDMKRVDMERRGYDSFEAYAEHIHLRD